MFSWSLPMAQPHPFALTHTPERTHFTNWTPDSRAVLVQEDTGGDERARLFQVEIDRPGEMQPLTEAHPPYFLRGGALAPDGRTLFYGANYDFSAGHELGPSWVYRHDLHSGQRTPIAFPQKPAYTIPELNQSGTHLIYGRKDLQSSGRQYHLVDAAELEDREIINFGAEVKTFARWFPDGKRILVLFQSTGQRSAGLHQLGCVQTHRRFPTLADRRPPAHDRGGLGLSRRGSDRR